MQEKNTNLLEDASQLLKNLGGNEGIALEVAIDNKSLWKLSVIIVGAVVIGVITNKIIDIA